MMFACTLSSEGGGGTKKTKCIRMYCFDGCAIKVWNEKMNATFFMNKIHFICKRQRNFEKRKIKWEALCK